MNERIKELAEQAGFKTDRLGHLFGGDDIEKFAELIVRECVQTLFDNTPELFANEAAVEDWDKGYDRAMKDCVHHIQEHFGLE